MTHPTPDRWRGLYAIVDPEHCLGRAPATVARAVLRGGCGALQLRSKALGDRALLELARELAAICRPHGVPFVVNDRPDLALLAGADGVHLGRDDLRLEDARLLFAAGPIGLSTHDEEQARDAQASGADLIGFGPIFATTSKARPDPEVGLDRLAAVCSESRVPVVAIGGLDAERAAAARAAGAAMVAVVSAVCGADDPARAAAAIHRSSGGPP